VKAKGGRERGDPLEMVTAEKRRRIARAAEAWLAANPEQGSCEARFEFVAVRSGRLERLSDPP
jgi:Holliday junction resolvase-like predicted endonuclease